MTQKKHIPTSKKSHGGRMFALLIFVSISLIIFLPTTILCAVAMIPSIVAFTVDRTDKKYLALTIAVMNVAGAVPFILQLWSRGHNMNEVTQIMTDPITIVIMYAAAGSGYVINWFVSDMASGFLIKKAERRMRSIEKSQHALIEQWGPTVGRDGLPSLSAKTGSS